VEKERIEKDDLLGRLISRTSVESPSEDFVDRVMSGIPVEPLLIREKKPFYLFLKGTLPWILLSVAVIAVLFTSDIPFLSDIPGKTYFTQSLGPYLLSMFSGFTKLFTDSKVGIYSVMILFAGGGLLALDYFLNNRVFSRQRTA
jgi:hypothetical protein